MNKRRLAAIARWLEAGAPEKNNVVGFNMREGAVYMEKKETAEETLACGTICCIAGAAVCFFNDPVKMIKSQMGFAPELGRMLWNDVSDEGRMLLDLNFVQSTLLFHTPSAFDVITPAWAARCIRKLIATGEVDWHGTQEG